MVKNEIKTGKARHWLDEYGIVHSEYFGNSEVTLEDAKTEVVAIDKLNGGKRAPTLVHIGGVKSVSRDARKYYSSEESAQTIAAAALLISSELSKILANFFMGINRPIMPVKLFTSKDEAIDWLSSF